MNATASSTISPAPISEDAAAAWKDQVATALVAFFAILQRDLLVTWRNAGGFLLEVLLQPVFFLFIFGTVLPAVGMMQRDFGALILPGTVALTVFSSAIQSVTVPLILDLGYAREIDDRLLAPLPVSMVTLEKVVFAALRGLLAGGVIFPLAAVILGPAYQVRSDALVTLISIMVLTAITGASIGMFIGTLVKPEKIGLLLTLIFTPLVFTGCPYYPWVTLSSIKWLQIITLFNPLTYASEGLRATMLPALHGQLLPTLGVGWSAVGLGLALTIFLSLGVVLFRKRVVS